MIGANSERECCGWLSEREFGLCGGPSPYIPEPRRFRPSRNHRSGMLHKQSFDLLEPEAGIARTLVDFDPRRAPFA